MRLLSAPTGINTGFHKHASLLLMVLLSGVLLASHAQARQLYRFTVDGAVVLKDHVPAEYSHLGYQVLNSQGMVVRTEPAPTKEELEQRRAAEAAAKAQRSHCRTTPAGPGFIKVVRQSGRCGARGSVKRMKLTLIFSCSAGVLSTWSRSSGRHRMRPPISSAVVRKCRQTCVWKWCSYRTVSATVKNNIRQRQQDAGNDP